MNPLGPLQMSLAQFQEFQLLLHEGETLTKDVPLGWTIPFWQKARANPPACSWVSVTQQMRQELSFSARGGGTGPQPSK